MAIQTRRYRCVGLTAQYIAAYVAPLGVTSTPDSDFFSTLTYDDTLVDVVDLDQAMATQGCKPDSVTIPATPQRVASGTSAVAGNGGTATEAIVVPANSVLTLLTSVATGAPIDFGAGLDIDANLRFVGPAATDWEVRIINNSSGALNVKWAVLALEVV